MPMDDAPDRLQTIRCSECRRTLPDCLCFGDLAEQERQFERYRDAEVLKPGVLN